MSSGNPTARNMLPAMRPIKDVTRTRIMATEVRQSRRCDAADPADPLR
jgi:hypothetical protein